MDTPDYRLTIRARPEGGFNPDVEMLDTRLGRIPGVTITGSGGSVMWRSVCRAWT